MTVVRHATDSMEMPHRLAGWCGSEQQVYPMIATHECNADSALSSELVTKLRLVQLQHSTDPQAAAIATAATLLLSRIDRLVAALGGVA